MTPILLACGPFFDESGFVASLIVLLLIKPLAYFAFTQAFRFRVSRPIPMRFRHAAVLTVARTALGLLFIGSGALVLYLINSDGLLAWSWVYLYGERVFSWWVIGRYGAHLRGRRLIGWIISGTLINATFDFAIVAGLLAGWMWPSGACAAIAAFILLLHLVGRRDSLQARFRDGSHCLNCDYDLMGNLSGRCPECGRSIDFAPPAVPYFSN